MKSETHNSQFSQESATVVTVRVQNQNSSIIQMNMNTITLPIEAAPKTRWMVVDDNKDLLLMMQMIIEHICGHAVECFDSPKAALNAFNSAPEAYKVVITDFEMPGMNGLEFCRRVRAAAHDVKVLLATGSGFFTEAEAAEAGFIGLLNKPFRPKQLSAILENAGIITAQVAHA